MGRYCIYDDYGEPIHVLGCFTVLDGHEMHHEIFEGNFKLQIMPRR